MDASLLVQNVRVGHDGALCCCHKGQQQGSTGNMHCDLGLRNGGKQEYGKSSIGRHVCRDEGNDYVINKPLRWYSSQGT